MPGIDYDKLREEITMEDVLRLVGFKPLRRTGDQWYGRCPLHEPSPGRTTPFSVNVAARLYCCHKCRSQGHHLTLWATFLRRPLHKACIALCHALGREVPWIYRW